MTTKYRVKVVVENRILDSPVRKYVIQKRFLWFWTNYCESTIDKNWAYETCDELNTPYLKMKEYVVGNFYDVKDF